MGSRITKNLVSQSLFKAVAAKRPGAGLIHHSDRGRQYCAHEYRKLMDQFKMRLSMSRKGDCYDNAPMESFWGTLKNELIHHCRYNERTGHPGDHRIHRGILQSAKTASTAGVPIPSCL